MRYIVLMLVPAFVPVGRHLQDGAVVDLERLQGAWILTHAERAQPISADKMIGNTAMITGNEYRRFTGEVPAIIYRKFKLLPDTYPRAIDLYADDGGQEFVYKGIVDFKGDTFRFCFALHGAERPREFQIGPGSTADSITTYRLVQRAK
jgi:uncharacterized protein (TIGR03067 family)